MTVAVGARNLVRVDAGVVHALLNERYYVVGRLWGFDAHAATVWPS